MMRASRRRPSSPKVASAADGQGIAREYMKPSGVLGEAAKDAWVHTLSLTNQASMTKGTVVRAWAEDEPDQAGALYVDPLSL